VIDDLLLRAGPSPARAADARWRQVALLATAAALGGDGRARTDLAAALQSLDHPEAAAAAVRAVPDQPWARWWSVLAAGQSGVADVESLVETAAAAAPAAGPDGREVARRLDDLREELAALAGTGGEGARFSLLGVTGGTPRRALLVGRSSAAFLVEPSWEGVRVVRLAPSDGPSAGNRAHLGLAEVVEGIRRGERGADRPVPGDVPRALEAGRLLEGLREDPEVRDRRLLALADEVREERARLAEDRARLRQEKSTVAAILRQATAIRDRGAAGAAQLPTSRADAAALLEVPPDAPPAEVERAFRRQVVRCHPDRVAELHPSIRGQAEGLTVALNAARELLVDAGAPRRRR
jgi:hypothetical protein